MGTGTGVGTETRAVAEIGTGTRMRTGTRTGLGITEEWRKRARNRTRVVKATEKTGETWAKREKKRRQERVGSVAANPDISRAARKQGGKHTVLRTQVRTLQV